MHATKISLFSYAWGGGRGRAEGGGGGGGAWGRGEGGIVVIRKPCNFLKGDDQANRPQTQQGRLLVAEFISDDNRKILGHDRVCLLVAWLLNVPATCECISGTDLLRQFYVLPH